MCKGSCRRKPTEGLFLQPLSARPASVLRTLANPFHHFVVPLPLHMGGEFRTRLGPAFKRSHKPKKPLLRFRAGEGFFHSISQFFLSLIAACAVPTFERAIYRPFECCIISLDYVQYLYSTTTSQLVFVFILRK